MRRFLPLFLLLILAAPSHAVSIVAHSYIPQSTGCTTTPTNSCTFPFTVSNTGDTAIFWISFCAGPSCNISYSSFSASDGTNTWTWNSAATVIGMSGGTFWSKAFFVCQNATAGTYNITVSGSGGTGGAFYYSQIEKVELSGTNTSSALDSAVSNNAVGSSTSPSVTSAGNVTASGELAIASFNGNTALINSGSYTLLDYNSTDVNGTYYYTNPTSGSTTTAAVTASNGQWWASIVAIVPSSGSTSPSQIGAFLPGP